MPPDGLSAINTNSLSKNDDKIMTKKKKGKFFRKSRNIGYAASQLNSLLSQSSNKKLGNLDRSSNPMNIKDDCSSDEENNISPFGNLNKHSTYDSGQGEMNFNQYIPTTLRQETLPEFIEENKETSPNLESDDSAKTRS